MCVCKFGVFPHQWQSWHSWMYSFQKHRCRHTQLAQWNWPATTGCPRTDQSQGPPFQHEPVCVRGGDPLSKGNNSNVLIHLEEVSLRWASVQFGVFQCKDVNSAFVTGGAQEWGVVAEVYTGEDKTREKWQLLDKKRDFKCFPCFFFSYFWPYM